MTALFALLLAGELAFLGSFALGIYLHVVLPRRLEKAALVQKETPTPEDEVRQALASVQSTLWGHSTPEIKAKMARLESTFGILRPRLGKLGSSTYHTVVSTATTYLPDAAKAYVYITRDARNTELVDGKKTATELFCEQLDIMNAELKKALDEATKVDATDLIVHGRFLEGKYGKAEPVLEDVSKVEADGKVGHLTAGSITSSKIAMSTRGDRMVLDENGFRRYRSQDHRDCEEIVVRSASGEVESRYCSKPDHEDFEKELVRALGAGEPDFGIARYHAPGELPDVPKPFKPIPEGTYPVAVVDAEAWVSKGGNPGFRLELVVTSGNFAGRRLRKTLVVPHSEQGMRMFDRQVAALGARCDLQTVGRMRNAEARSMFLGRFAYAPVRIDDYNGRVFNSVAFLTSDYRQGTLTK